MKEYQTELFGEDLPIHKLCKYFPEMEGKEFDLLVESIKEHGQLKPITLYQGKILDGKNRYRACRRLGIEPITKDFTGNDPLSYVISMNVRRAHLTESQRVMIAIEMEKEFEGRIES